MSWSPMVIAAAKELNKRVADSCNVNADDQWALDGEVYISDADAMLKAAGIGELVQALHSSLWVLDHPDVNAIKFCGNPKEQAKRIRALIAEFCPTKELAICDASAVFQAPGARHGVAE